MPLKIVTSSLFWREVIRLLSVVVLVPDILMSLDIKAVEVVIFHESLLLLFVFAVLQPFHDCQLHLHGDVHRQYRLQQVLLQTHTHN